MGDDLKFGYAQLIDFIGIDEEKVSNLLNCIKVENILPLIGLLSIIEKNSMSKELQEKSIECTKKLSKSKGFYKYLEELPALSINIDDEMKIDIDNIINMQFSIENMRELSMRDFEIPLYDYSGLIRLFVILINNDNENLINIINKTNRYDLKIVYLKILFSEYSFGVDREEFYKSRFDFVRMYYILKRYRLNNHSRIFCQEKDINGLFQLEITKRDKFLVYLYYLINQYHGKTIWEIEKDEQIKDFATKLFSLEYEFTESEFFSQSKHYYAPLYVALIGYLSDSNKRNGLFVSLFNYLQDFLQSKINRNEHCSSQIDFQISIILGIIASDLDDNFYNNLRKRFEKFNKELSFPYTFCMDKHWSFQIAYMFCFLLAICTYKQNKNMLFAEEIKDFETTISSHKHYLDKEFNAILKQLKDYSHLSTSTKSFR